MIKLLRTILYIGVFSLGLLSTANANLEARWGGMVYDTDLNITWLSDANYAKTSGFDADGRMRVTEEYAGEGAIAKEWVATLNVGGVSGWRLPTFYTCDEDGFCTDGEMVHLFHNELGGTDGFSILLSSDPDLALFTNVQSDLYWSDTGWRGDSARTLAFNFNHGYNAGAYDENKQFFAWPVHSGDVAAIPEPETYAMMVLGLAVLLGFGRLRKQS